MLHGDYHNFLGEGLWCIRWMTYLTMKNIRLNPLLGVEQKTVISSNTYYYTPKCPYLMSKRSLIQKWLLSSARQFGRVSSEGWALAAWSDLVKEKAMNRNMSMLGKNMIDGRKEWLSSSNPLCHFTISKWNGKAFCCSSLLLFFKGKRICVQHLWISWLLLRSYSLCYSSK